MIKKQISKIRRMKKVRAQIREHVIPRLSVHRTPKHIYAQVLSPMGDKVIAAASSLEKIIKEEHAKDKGKISIATKIGAIVAKRAIEKGIKKVAFDRSGFKFHGRVKAVAEGAREGGLNF